MVLVLKYASLFLMWLLYFDYYDMDSLWLKSSVEWMIP